MSARETMAATLDIAHVVENLERGGLERMVIDLAMAQRAAGHRPRVACLFEPGALAGELEGQGIEVFACRKQGGLDLRAVRRLRDWVAAIPGTVIHTHNANAHYHAVAATFGRTPARLVNTRHGMGASRPRSRGEWLYRRSMWRTDAVAAVCEAARARFATQGVRPRSGLLAVPNGIRVETFGAASEERRAALRNVLGLAPGTRILGTVGRLNPIKDQSTLLRAFARVHAEAADTALVLVGDGALRAALEAQASASGAGDAVRFLGDRSDVRQLLQGFDLFVLSSLSEGYSMALLEACASGLPIVATDVGGNREIVVDERNGVVVPAADEAVLAAALVSLLRDPPRAQRLGAAGRDWALREASIETMAARYDRLYREAAHEFRHHSGLSRAGPGRAPRSFKTNPSMNPRPRKLQVLRWLPNRWVLTRGSRRRRVLYLTFDDGPHPEHTPVLLDLLAKYRARATFYLIGQQAERNAEVVRRIVSEGHALGNHSWSHPQFDRLSLVEQRREIEHTERLLARFDGQARHDFRPPRGVMPVPMVLDCIRRGQRIAFWSYDSLDYSQRPADELIEVARRHPPLPGEIVLMHDDGGLSLAVLETMLPLWAAEGFTFEPLPSA